MPDTVDPNDFIITRKRKKYKFAKFLNSPLCFEFDEWQKRPVDTIEIGAGTGLFSVELAKQHPNKQFLAIDVKADRLQKGAYKAMDLGLSNIKFLRARADQLNEIVSNDTVNSIWITFPDPFAKKRSAARRLTHSRYLELYKSALRNDGRIHLKHDNRDFFLWSLEQLVVCQWKIEELSFDLHGSDLPEAYKIKTTYEERWLKEGLVTNMVTASI